MEVLNIEKRTLNVGARYFSLGRYLLLVLLALILSACNNGGGSDLPPVSPDNTPPTASFNPPPDQNDVLVGSTINIQFSEPVTKAVANLNAGDFGICEIINGSPDCLNNSIPFSFNFDEANSLVTLDPITDLVTAKEYMIKANIYGTITDTSPAKNPMGGVASARFSTTKPPSVTATMPGNPGPNSIISASFSEAMKSTSITGNTFTVKVKNGSSITGNVSLSGDGLIASFLPSTALVTGTAYTATMSTGATDLADNTLIAYSWDFILLAPAAVIHFPTPVSLTDATTLTVTGAASDEGNIMGVSVNGVPATSTDGFATWRAQVNIVPGENTLVVSAEDIARNVNASAAQAIANKTESLFEIPGRVALDTANNRALVTDQGLAALLAVNLTTGNRTIISDANTGSGPAFIQPFSITLDAANNRALVVDFNLDAIIAVDLATGNRTVVSNASNGSGPIFTFPRGITLDAINNRALVTGGGLRALMAVDLATGNRTVISSAKASTGIVGSGKAFISLSDIVLDSANNRALITDDGFRIDALVAVDLATGNRTVFSDATTGSGPAIIRPYGITLDAANNRVLVTDFILDVLMAVDLTTGNRTIVSDANTGSGQVFIFPNGTTLDATNNRALVIDGSLDALVAVDLTTGNRTIVSGDSSGSGPAISGPSGIYLDVANNRALVIDGNFASSALVSVDLATSNRTIISSNAVTGSGPVFKQPFGVTLDAANNRALVTDFNLDLLMAVNLTTGNRTVHSSATTGSGPVFNQPFGVTLDAANNRALVTNRELRALLAVDIVTGNRTIISDATTGSGPAFSSPYDIFLDATNNRVLVANSGSNALVAVDLSTGNRTIISNASTGSGPVINWAFGVTLDVTNNRALVTDNYGLRALLAVDLTTGNRTIISSANIGNGPAFIRPYFVTLDAANNRALVADSGLGAMVAVELVSGDRVIVSK